MKLNQFKLERYFAEHEFSTKHLLCCSDCDGLKMGELLNMADNECIKLWENLTLGYTDSKGHPLLREEIAKLYNGISTDDILVCAPEEGIFVALNSIIPEYYSKGYRIKYDTVCTFPAYQSLCEILKLNSSEIYKWFPQEKEGWKFNVEYLNTKYTEAVCNVVLEKKIINNTKALIINFPHNPTGYLPSQQDFLKIIELAKENSVYVFSDEIYRFLEFDENDKLPSACELYDKAISLFGMSKTFGLAGLRIGWLITKDKKIMKQFETFKDYTTICSSAPSEILALIALRNKDFIISKNLKTIKENLNYLTDFFNRYSKIFSLVKPKAGTVCFPELLGTKTWNIDSYTFCEKVRKEAGILLLPSKVYDYGDKHFRIGFGRKDMPEVLLKFEDYLNKIL